MLKELQIRNFALIEELELSFYSGFSVLSGETGAGKSIIIDALSLILGARASVEMIRTGALETLVSGSFTLNPRARALLEEWGMLDGEELIITRELSASGRSKCWINGRLATVSQLAQLGPLLVDVVGQHDSQSLLDPQGHGELLDLYGGQEHLALLKEADELAQKWLALKAEQRRLQQDERERNRRIDLLNYQVEEINGAELKPGEDLELEQERLRLANLDRIRQAVQTVLEVLGEEYETRGSFLSSLSFLEGELQKAAGLDLALEPLAQRYVEISLNLHDFYRELRDYLEQLPADPGRLNEVEERLHLIDGLKRKYGSTVDEILSYAQEAQEELEVLKSAGQRREDLEAECRRWQEEWTRCAGRLTKSREALAYRLEGEIENELAELAMGSTRFKVQFRPRESSQPVLGGAEEVEFMMAANVGEELKPLAKIASGGELSRVLLAVKAILVKAEQTPTVVFDEIDAGIGGRTAVSLGEKLRSLGQFRQVLCVTHLPVVASFGTHHYSVQKAVRQDRTTVQVALLSPEERVDELTRMLGGAAGEGITAEHARELLKRTSFGI